MAFVRRRIDLAIRLAPRSGVNQPNTFVESGTDTVNVKGLRTSARIQNSGSPVANSASISVYGLAPSLMNQLSTLGLVFNLVPKNTVTISAGEDTGTGALPVVFSGTIILAYADYASQPDVPFKMECLAGVADAVAPAPVSSFTGATGVVTIMQGLARQMGMGFENNGISVQLSSPYFSGPLWGQAQKCAEHAGIEWGVFSNTLAIWKRGGNRNTPDIPVIADTTGMIGYPSFTQGGIIVSTVFDPKLSFGQLVKVKSSLLDGIALAQTAQQPLANRQIAAPNASIFPTTWAINKLDLALDAQIPHGEWRATCYCYNPNYPAPIPQPVQG